jgi:hypothetical protein
LHDSTSSKTENARERRPSLILHDNLSLDVGLARKLCPTGLAVGGLSAQNTRALADDAAVGD